VNGDQLAIDRSRWDLVIGSIAVFLLFLGLIPVRVKADWRSHGLYVAFVVSLFAEMFGFPLSAYFLSTALGLTLFERQFMLYMYRIGMPLGSLVTFLGVLLIVLGWREVYPARDRLATGGIYRYVRHPQYLGILLVTAGWLVHWPTLPGLLMWPVLALLYYRLSVREERYLIAIFGDAYRAYAARTPRLLPVKLHGA
jgi:protein-S-isoprenylcysteine O-methyltransferase Ste14